MSEEKIGAVLIVGAGIAGMQSALDLADSGFKVYLLTEYPSIGGYMAELDKTFPTNDCAMCIISPKLVDVAGHPNIELLTNCDLLDLSGEPGHFTAKIRKRTRYVDEEKCTGCGSCASVCPVEILDDFNENLIGTKNIFIPFPQAVPLKAIRHEETCMGCGLCKLVCAADAIDFSITDSEVVIDVGSVVVAAGYKTFDPNLMKEYRYDHPDVIQSIEFERFLAPTGPTGGHVIKPSTGEDPKSIAWIQCVGSRNEKLDRGYCSSVCCTYAIKEAVIAKEHSQDLKCTIFYMDMRTFGKGFEEYYNRAKDEYGLEFIRCRVPAVKVRPDQTLAIRYENEEGEIEEREFDMVVLSVGFQPPDGKDELSRVLNVNLNRFGFCETSEFAPLDTNRDGVYVCGAFVEPKDIPETVAQASGASAKASSVIAASRNTQVQEREYPEEHDITGELPRIGVFVCHCGINIASVVDVMSVVEYAKTLPGVVFAENNLYACSQDNQGHIKEVIKEYNLNRVVVASCSPRTHEPLFRNTCREAGLNPYLFEMGNIRDQCSWVHMHEPERATEKAKDIVRMAVAKSNMLKPLQNIPIDMNHDCMVIGGGIAGMTAASEMTKQGYKVYLVEKTDELGGNMRSIRYSLTGDNPQVFLQEMINEVESNPMIEITKNAKIDSIEGYIGNFKANLTVNGSDKKEIDCGVVIVATGAVEYKPEEYLYGKNDRVITQHEFEERMDEGKLDLADKTVVMIQCVGSREDERTYCSRVCCATAIKNAIVIKENYPSANVYVLYRDIRAYGFKEEYYKKARDLGVTFIRYAKEEKPEVVEEGGILKISVVDQLFKEKFVIESDLLILSAATLPASDNPEISELLKLPLTEHGFFLEAHAKLRPVDFATDGVFLCGLAHSPKLIGETVSQACAAVSRACTILSKEFIEAEGTIASVNEVICSGCGLCVAACPYEVPELIVNEHGALVARINEAKCKGCGVCGCGCPSSAIIMNHFMDKQIISQIDAFGVA
ncbi:heterodisulfide reductase [Methanosarcinales archaeon]|nr:MAG: heterodisulfide reductase [Methanosarcinales archaeon]